MWTNFFRDGGWGMYPVLFWGFIVVAAGVLVVLRPERRYFALMPWLITLAFGSGVLGTCVGVVKTFRAIHELPGEQQLLVACLGCAEALNCTILGLMVGILATTLAAAAAARAAWSKKLSAAQ